MPACELSLVSILSTLVLESKVMNDVEIPKLGGVTVKEYTMSAWVQYIEFKLNYAMVYESNPLFT